MKWFVNLMNFLSSDGLILLGHNLDESGKWQIPVYCKYCIFELIIVLDGLHSYVINNTVEVKVFIKLRCFCSV